jgi:hypothetical protein
LNKFHFPKVKASVSCRANADYAGKGRFDWRDHGKVVLNGRGDEIANLAKTNSFRLKAAII